MANANGNLFPTPADEQESSRFKGCLLLVAVLLLASCGGVGYWLSSGPKPPPRREVPRRVVVLAFDGVDLAQLQQQLKYGELPELERLATHGGLCQLAPDRSAASAATWLTAAVGSATAHATFDRCALTHQPLPYSLRPTPLLDRTEATFLWDLFPTRWPDVQPAWDGEPYWETASRAGVRTVLLFAPLGFPCREVSGLTTVSGLFAPGLHRPEQRYGLLTTNEDEFSAGETVNGGYYVQLQSSATGYRAHVFGPQQLTRREKLLATRHRMDQLLAAGRDDASVSRANQNLLQRLHEQLTEQRTAARLVFPVDVRPMPDGVEIEVAGETQLVNRHAWSRWFRIRFSRGGMCSSAGIVRFYVLDLQPHLRIYMSPVQAAPPAAAAPWFALSHEWQPVLAGEPYVSCGAPVNSGALADRFLSEEACVQQLQQNFAARNRRVVNAIGHGNRWDLLVAGFRAPGEAGRWFWRALDEQHPAHTPDLAIQHRDTVPALYRQLDRQVGEVRHALEQLGGPYVLLVYANHGLAPWRTCVNLNTWLAQHHYLRVSRLAPPLARYRERRKNDVLADGAANLYLDKRGRLRELYLWKYTRAWSAGGGSIFINLAGRDPAGCVAPADYEPLRQSLKQELLALRDGEQPVIAGVYLPPAALTRATPTETLRPRVPDLLVHFTPGYAASRQSRLGGLDEEVIFANRSRESATACGVAPAAVPGWLFCNLPLSATRARLQDLAATVLTAQDIPLPAGNEGQSLLK